MAGCLGSRWRGGSHSKGVAAEIWESADAPGGLIGTQQAGGYTMERAASLMLNFRPEVGALLAQSGLNERRLALRADLPRFVLQGGALARVPMRAGALLVAPF
ncbi:MAG: hypothetical protein HS128_07220 [Ideonella sp.]|nr:hypothetical protein [Ideonella sp.]